MDFKIFFLLSLFLAIYEGTQLKQTGLKIRVSKKGLDYAGEKLIDDLSIKLKTTSIPDTRGSKGRVTYSVENVKLNHFGKPRLVYTGNNGNIFWLRLNGASLSGNGDWRYRYKKAWFKISDHGSVRISASGINIGIHSEIGVLNSKPTIKTKAVDFSISHLSVKFRGKMAWFYNFLVGFLKKSVKRQIEKQVRTLIRESIDTKLNKQLDTYKPEVKVLDRVVLSYGFSELPMFATDYIEASLKGTFPQNYYTNYVPLVMTSDKMASLAISETSFNNFAKLVYGQGILSYVYTDSNAIQSLLSLKEENTNQTRALQVRISAVEAPRLNISSNQISCELTVKIVIENLQEGNFTLMAAQITVAPAITMSVENDLIKFEVLKVPFSDLKIEQDFVFLDATKIVEALNKIMDWLLPQLNEEAKKGFKMPSFKKVSLLNGVVKFNEGYVEVATDFTFNN